MLVSGGDPIEAYKQIVIGALAPGNLSNTLNWATPLVGMTLAAAIPLRGGMINLGGDGQMVIGGLVGATIPLFLPLPGPLAAVAALVGAALAAGLYASSRRLGRDAASHPHADLEPAAELSRGRPRLLSREVPAARCDNGPAADRARSRRRAIASAVRRGQCRIARHRGAGGARRLHRPARGRRLRTSHARQERALCRLRRRAPRPTAVA